MPSDKKLHQTKHEINYLKNIGRFSIHTLGLSEINLLERHAEMLKKYRINQRQREIYQKGLDPEHIDAFVVEEIASTEAFLIKKRGYI